MNDWKSKIITIAATILLLFGGLILVGSTPDDRLEPSGSNSSFSHSGVSFREYIEITREMISRTRLDLPATASEQVINGNAPFERAPSAGCTAPANKTPRRGILLLHGLTDSPYSIRTLGDHFARKCFHVMAMLLPGHGSRPGDLLDVSWQEWSKAVRFGIDALDQKVDQLYLLGFSTGGTLSIYQAMTDQRIKGLFLFSPAVAVSPVARFSCWLDQLGWMSARLRWIDLQPDKNYYKYESFAANAACQVFKLTKEIDATMTDRPLHIPVFIAASEDDTTVDTKATITFFVNNKARTKRMLLYSARKPDVPDDVLLVNSALANKRIVSSSHVGITLPASDPYYGEAGDYAFCSHYYQGQDEENTEYKRCKNGQNILLGEATKTNRKLGTIRRLTYNPNYESMLFELDKFINHLP